MHTLNFLDWGAICLFLAGAINFGYSMVELKKTRHFCKTLFSFEEELTDRKTELEAKARRDFYNLALKRFKRRLCNAQSAAVREVAGLMSSDTCFKLEGLLNMLDEEIVQEDENVKWELIP